MSISPSLSPRQCPDRYAFRAGRNLPDKEFRYLRTVIVTAAVHRGFGRRLPCHQVTNFLDLPALGRRQPPYMVLRLCGDLCFCAVAPGALAGDPGCFPLDDEAYPPSSHWPTLTLVILRSYLVFRVCLDLVPLSRPAPKQCFTPRCLVNCCASTHFGENQLALDSLSLRLRWFPLTKPLPMSRRLILQQARGQSPELSSSSHCLGAYGFMFYFTPRWGFFSPFPHGTTSLSVTQEYLALQGGPC
ncbi:hypothetical protein VNO78_37618 [Psophocarpus tetragonolobus]|uniref:Uncharacterized protein n=1 Tax=Psophocarpus tetragonolobus TaxID=3891 RepID=A0AAN9NCL1_PSOTE